MPDNQKNFEKIIDAQLELMAEQVLDIAKLRLIINDSTDTNQLLRSGKIESKPLEKTIYFDAPHAKYIEFGTPPHGVSEKGRIAIRGWAKRKLNLSDADAESASWGIVNKIRVHGMEAKPFLRPALDEVLSVYGVK